MALFKKKIVDVPRRRQATLNGAVRPESTYDESQNVFRRNRTITGSTSVHITPIEAKADLESPRTLAHNLTLRRRKIMGTLFIILLVVAFLGWLIFEYTAKPTIVVSSSTITRPLDVARYQKAIQNYLNSNPLARLRIGLNDTSLSQYISRVLPEVSAVKQEGFSGFGTTDFEITLRVPVAGWTIGGSQYYVDSAGIPFQVNYFAAPTVQIDDESGVDITEGTAIVSNSFLGFVGRVVSSAKSYGYIVTNAIIPSGTTRQLEIKVSGFPFLVKLSIDRGATEQIEDMNRSILFLETESTTPKYIDVRVSGKAFYM